MSKAITYWTINIRSSPKRLD